MRAAPPAAFRPGVRASVVVPCYNQGEYLLEAVASVEAIPGDAHELVVVDDGSDEQVTLPILQHVADRGHHVVHQPNRGLAAARNAGIRAAHGAVILPLDADNTVGPGYLAAALARFDADPGTGVVYSDAEYFGARGGPWTVGAFDARRLACGNFIDACAVIRRSTWEALGGYDEGMPIPGWEDWDLWLRVLESGRWTFHYVPEPLFRYRVHAASMQARLHGPENVSALIGYMAEKHRDFFGPRFPRIWATLLEELVALRGERAHAAEAVATLGHTLAARDEELASVKYVLSARDEELASVKFVLAARDVELAAVKARLEALDAERR
jgi:glycosyltransferase involved in cell wall biosynthesis